MSFIESFPWDSIATELGEDGFPIYDRSWAASDLREVWETFFSNGIFINHDEAFVVKAGTGMTVSIGTGKCCVRGTVGYTRQDSLQTSEIMSIDFSETQLPRIDTIALRWDANLSSRAIYPIVIKGKPDVKPVRPNLTRTSVIYDLGLADILIKPNTTAINQANILDTRLETARCGIVTPLIEFNTTSLFERMNAALDQAIKEHKAAAEKQMNRLNNEIDKVIFVADRITNGKPNSCGCYKELQLVKQLLYELLMSQNDAKYYVIGKTAYAPPARVTVLGNKATFNFNYATVNDKTLELR